MLITVTFDADTPAAACAVLDEVQARIRYEFNPGEWKRPCRILFGAVIGRAHKMSVIHTTIEMKE